MLIPSIFRSTWVALFAVAGLGACAGPAPGQGDADVVVPAAETQAGTLQQNAVPEVPTLPAVPVDASLVAVSRSTPSAEAEEALNLCVRPQDYAAVAGMARLANGGEVKKYMLTNGAEPELEVDAPVWMVQLKGPIHYRWGTPFNPVCVVIDGVPTIYVPYGSVERPDTPAPPDFVAPKLALPPMVP